MVISLFLISLQRVPLPWEAPEPEAKGLVALASALAATVFIGLLAWWEKRKHREENWRRYVPDELTSYGPGQAEAPAQKESELVDR